MEKKKQVAGAYKHTQENVGKNFFGILWFYDFFLDFWVIFAVRCLKITILFRSLFVPIQYITYPVLTSTKLLPLV